MDTAQETRRLCRLSSTLWVDGDGAGARKALQAAQHLALAGSAAATGQEHDDCNQLRIEVLAAASRLFLRAEEPAKALLASQVALQGLEQGDQLDMYGRAAALDLRVTYATEAVNQAPDAAARQALIEELDAVTAECLTASQELPDHGEITGRAVNNALLLRLQPLHEAKDISDPETQVQAWLWVGQARRAISAANMPESGLQPVNRQIVDLARRLGSWERAWEAVTQSLCTSYQRNEKVSLLAKAALLAWEHGNQPDAITYGNKARTASIAVDLPWVRVYAYKPASSPQPPVQDPFPPHSRRTKPVLISPDTQPDPDVHGRPPKLSSTPATRPPRPDTSFEMSDSVRKPRLIKDPSPR